jgi:hypothetical protein
MRVILAVVVSAGLVAAISRAATPRQEREGYFAQLEAMEARLASPDVTPSEVAQAVRLIMKVQGWSRRP